MKLENRLNLDESDTSNDTSKNPSEKNSEQDKSEEYEPDNNHLFFLQKESNTLPSKKKKFFPVHQTNLFLFLSTLAFFLVVVYIFLFYFYKGGV